MWRRSLAEEAIDVSVLPLRTNENETMQSFFIKILWSQRKNCQDLKCLDLKPISSGEHSTWSSEESACKKACCAVHSWCRDERLPGAALSPGRAHQPLLPPVLPYFTSTRRTEGGLNSVYTFMLKIFSPWKLWKSVCCHLSLYYLLTRKMWSEQL
jgi:hypothetical protein